MTVNPPPIIIAQISDSHLFASKQGLHCGVNVFDNFIRILAELSAVKNLSAIFFTGDLTQDHTQASYELFNQALADSLLTVPCYYVAGNHDDAKLLTQCLLNNNVVHERFAEFNQWQVLLLNSKSETPAGLVAKDDLARLNEQLVQVSETTHQLIFMHHHPHDVGYFIDRHGLKNQHDFWRVVNQGAQVKAIACGHVHRGQTYWPSESTNQIPLYTCPATSIQFDPNVDKVAALPLGPGYRLFTLNADGTHKTSLHYLPR